MAHALVGRGALPDQVDNSIGELETTLAGATQGTMRELGEIVMQSWYEIGFAVGFGPWGRAAQHFARLLSLMRDHPVDEELIVRLLAMVEESRTEALLDLDYSEHSRVKLMTYHQTKGREVDTAIHLYRDIFGTGGEPYEEASRVLNVAISRARKRVVMILPTDPHLLVKPFNDLTDVQKSVLESM